MTATTMFQTSVCTCNPLADEHCYVCRNRHNVTGQACMAYEKTTPLLAVESVSKSYGDKTILRDVNVKIRKVNRAGMPTGRIVSFLGPSGCGKTTLLRILAGLDHPTSGNVYLGTDRTPVHAGLVGLVSQQYLVYPNRTAVGNLRVAAMQKKTLPLLNKLMTYFPRRKQATDEAMAMLRSLSTDRDKTDLVNVADSFPGQLSGGQRQRIAIGQQLLCSEHYLLMDEPTASLDPKGKQEVSQIISDVANSGDGITIIIVTHDISTAAAVSDTIWLMGRDRDTAGKIIPGARIVDTYDLIECGLTWNPSARRHPAYAPLVEELKERFDTL